MAAAASVADRRRSPVSTSDRLLRRLADRAPLVCGIVNVTPDSFSDGGRYTEPTAAIDHGLAMIEQGAELLDIGGESTRPGSRPPSVAEEIARVVPVVDALARSTSIPISVDTSRPAVMRAAVAAGACFINDVRALRHPGALHAAAALEVPVCLVHMRGDPETMQHSPRYADVVAEVREFLLHRVAACVKAGIPRERIVVDPGFGFGKTLEHNLDLLANLRHIADIGMPGDGWPVAQSHAGHDHRPRCRPPSGRFGCRRPDRRPERCLGAAGARRGRNGRCHRGSACGPHRCPALMTRQDQPHRAAPTPTSSAARSAAAFTSS